MSTADLRGEPSPDGRRPTDADAAGQAATAGPTSGAGGRAATTPVAASAGAAQPPTAGSTGVVDDSRARPIPGSPPDAEPAPSPGPAPAAVPPAASPPIPLGPRRGGRRRLALAGAVAAAALVGVGTVVWRGQGGDTPSDPSSAAPTATAEVTVRDLEERTDLDGTLGYGDTHDLALATQGTITWLPPEGSVIDRGQAVAEVDDRVVPLLLGDRPMWRELGPGVEDGVDVEQLEANLVALGVVSADDLTVDQEWTSATTEAVEDWQASLGLEETGRVAPGDVVVQPAAVRVTAWAAEPGGQAGGPALTVGGTARQVTIDLEATRQQLIQVGQAVEVELPDGSTTTGTVSAVGTVAEIPTDTSDNPMEDATPTVEVTIALDDPAAGANLDEAPVTVRVVTSTAAAVTAVPVDALLALAEGGYAVERVTPGGGTELVAVEIGAFADGWVEVTGDLAEGDDVVVPE
jgi:Putative peptidoglycan binding domain